MRRTLMLTILAMGLASLGCSVQEIGLIPIAIITGRIAVPADQRAITIRVNRVGTWDSDFRLRERLPVTAETAFCDVEGDFLLKTNKLGGGFITARGVEFDIGYTPVFLESYGDTLEIARLLPAEDVSLIAKTPGSTLFLAFEEDFTTEFGPIERIDLVGPTKFDLDDTAIPLHDDGSLVDIDPVTPGMQVSGDVAAGDKVWTVRVAAPRFPAGQQKYGFFINENLELGYQRDPYEESSDADRSVVLVK